MSTPGNPTPVMLMETEQVENSYFGNPYRLHYEQYGLEHLNRNDNSDDIERVVILGYN